MRFFRAHWGPVFPKSAFGAVPLLHLSFLSQRSRCKIRRRGGPVCPPLQSTVHRKPVGARFKNPPPSVTASPCHLPPWRGKAICIGSVGSANLGAEAELHQPQFLQTQGPVAREGFRPITQILRAGTSALTNQERVPVMGSGADSPCQGEMARRAREGRASEYERVSAHFEPSPGAFWFLCRHGQRNSPPGTRAVRTIKLSLAAKLRTLRNGPCGLPYETDKTYLYVRSARAKRGRERPYSPGRSSRPNQARKTHSPVSGR